MEIELLMVTCPHCNIEIATIKKQHMLSCPKCTRESIVVYNKPVKELNSKNNTVDFYEKSERKFLLGN